MTDGAGRGARNGHACRACRSRSGQLVLDLGEQPASDLFPPAADPGPDPVYPLQMWLCSACGLAQLMADPTVPEEPRGAEPAALVAQAADAVDRVARAGLLPPGGQVAEYGSPHGGSWLGLLESAGLTPAGHDPAEVVIDCFGLMHETDQAAALAARAAKVAPGGVLLLQYHSLAAIVRGGQWNALRHGHYAYYSAIALTSLLAMAGFSVQLAWQFELYGGTVLLAARRDADGPDGPAAQTGLLAAGPAALAQDLIAQDTRAGLCDPAVLRGLGEIAARRAHGLHDWLSAERRAGRSVLGYGAASRAVALLRRAGVTAALLPAVADAAPGKQGRRMPGTDIPVISPAQLAASPPDAVVVFLDDLLAEVRSSLPEVAASGGRWVTADALGPGKQTRPPG